MKTLTLVAALLCASHASAQQAPVPTDDSTVEQARAVDDGEVWYGWQTLTVDAAVLAFAVGSTEADLGAVVAMGYLLGAPAVHVAHGNGLRALGSVGLRVGLPIGAGLISYGLATDFGKNTGDLSGLAFVPGALLGLIAAVTLDAAWLARDSAEPARTSPRVHIALTHERALLVAQGRL